MTDPSLEAIRQQYRERYHDQLGRGRSEVTTPALLLDLDVARRNIATMAARFRELPTELRPHIKVHKSPELSLLQVQAGAIGVACATVWEASVMAKAGIADVLIANQVVQPDKVEALAALAAEHHLTVAVDDVRNVDQLEAAAARHGAAIDVLVEIDVGMGRCGVRSNEEALQVAGHAAASSRLRFCGMQGYEGHCMLEPDPEVRLRATTAANARLLEAVDYLAAHGLPSPIVSGGGTGTYYITGANPAMTEIQAGSYALMDCFHGVLVPGGFEFALTVLGTVVSAKGGTVVLDVGRKAVGIDFVIPPLAHIEGGEVRYYAEEHCLIDFAGAPPLALGDTAELLAGYGPTTVNLHDVFHVVERGVVTDIWPVTPRGAGRPN